MLANMNCKMNPRSSGRCKIENLQLLKITVHNQAGLVKNYFCVLEIVYNGLGKEHNGYEKKTPA